MCEISSLNLFGIIVQILCAIRLHFKPDELTFDEGDILYILDMTDPNWWKAKCEDRTGLIPSNYGEQLEKHK